MPVGNPRGEGMRGSLQQPQSEPLCSLDSFFSRQDPLPEKPHQGRGGEEAEAHR